MHSTIRTLQQAYGVVCRHPLGAGAPTILPIAVRIRPVRIPLAAPFPQSAHVRDKTTAAPAAGTESPTKTALRDAVNEAVEKEASGGSSPRQRDQGRQQSQTPRGKREDNFNTDGSVPHVTPDAVAEGDARGRTGGGRPLDSSSENAPPQPKILNAGVPGRENEVNLTDEQKKEVDKHNKEFEQKFDRGATAAGDKVDKSFWGEGRASD